MKILVDASVWIDLFADRHTPQTACARYLIDEDEPVAVGDLTLMEVLQGTRGPAQFERINARLGLFEQIAIVDRESAIQAARNYQHLRALGITVRKSIDTLIATRCILDRIPLLYSDRDFDPFVEHLGLISALDASGVS